MRFKNWFNEMANYGYGGDTSSNIRGGTEIIPGEEIFKTLDYNLIINELERLSYIGTFLPNKVWEDKIVWGEGYGSLKVNITPLGSTRLVIRRESKDLEGNNVEICKKVIPLYDTVHSKNEVSIAHDVYKELSRINEINVDGPDSEVDFFDIVKNIWFEVKKNHPSYIMFPTELKEINKNYYKMIFEIKGHGVQNLVPGPGRTEQFNIDVYYDLNKGVIRCWGYNIDSSLKNRSWIPQPSEWDECFFPTQDKKEITNCIIHSFLCY